MKAVMKAVPGPGLELRTAPDPTPGDDEVVLAVKATSMCGTDVHIYQWDAWAQGRIRPRASSAMKCTAKSSPSAWP